MKKVYLEAYACDDYGDGPEYAVLNVTPEFCGELQQLNALCAVHRLTELRTQDAPEAWGPGSVEEDLRFNSPELVVAGGSFWFTDHPKSATYDVETRSVGIVEFCETIAMHEGDEPLFFGADVDALKARVSEGVGT